MNDTSDFPPVLAEIAELIGVPAALALAAECGGTYICIAYKPGAQNKAARVIGVEAMRVLARHYGPRLLEMPIATHAHKRRRNDTIRAGARSGLSQSQLARRHQMTARHVRRICSADRTYDDREPDLFADFDKD